MPALDALIPGELAAVPDHVRTLEAAGIDGLFTYEGQTDPFLPIAVAAPDTSARLYTNIAVAFPRSPVHTAMQAWDLQRQSGGRFALGLGTQIKAHIERRFGSIWEQPLAQMREYIEALRALFEGWQHGTPISFEGRWTTHTLMPPMLTPRPLDCAVPEIWLAALGPRMTALAGEAADGLLVHPFTSRQALVDNNLTNLEIGLAAGRRSRAEITVVAGAIVGLCETDRERARAEAGVRGLLGFYGSTPAYRPVLDVHGWADLQPQLRELTKENRWGELGSLYSDEQMATLAVVGTPAQVAAELHVRFGDLADRIALSTPGLDRLDLLADLAVEFRS